MTAGDYHWISVGLKSQPELEFGLLALKPGGLLTEEDVQTLTKLVEAGKLGHGVWKTDDCQKNYKALKAKGVEFVQPPTDQPYGSIEAIFKDNSGNIMVRKSLLPLEWGIVARKKQPIMESSAV